MLFLHCSLFRVLEKDSRHFLLDLSNAEFYFMKKAECIAWSVIVSKSIGTAHLPTAVHASEEYRNGTLLAVPGVQTSRAFH